MSASFVQKFSATKTGTINYGNINNPDGDYLMMFKSPVPAGQLPASLVNKIISVGSLEEAEGLGIVGFEKFIENFNKTLQVLEMQYTAANFVGLTNVNIGQKIGLNFNSPVDGSAISISQTLTASDISGAGTVNASLYAKILKIATELSSYFPRSNSANVFNAGGAYSYTAIQFNDYGSIANLSSSILNIKNLTLSTNLYSSLTFGNYGLTVANQKDIYLACLNYKFKSLADQINIGGGYGRRIYFGIIENGSTWDWISEVLRVNGGNNITMIFENGIASETGTLPLTATAIQDLQTQLLAVQTNRNISINCLFSGVHPYQSATAKADFPANDFSILNAPNISYIAGIDMSYNSDPYKIILTFSGLNLNPAGTATPAIISTLSQSGYALGNLMKNRIYDNFGSQEPAKQARIDLDGTSNIRNAFAAYPINLSNLGIIFVTDFITASQDVSQLDVIINNALIFASIQAFGTYFVDDPTCVEKTNAFRSFSDNRVWGKTLKYAYYGASEIINGVVKNTNSDGTLGAGGAAQVQASLIKYVLQQMLPDGTNTDAAELNSVPVAVVVSTQNVKTQGFVTFVLNINTFLQVRKFSGTINNQ